jgi:hypothetical protein
MKTIKLALVSLALVAAVSATATAQVVARGGGGGGTGGALGAGGRGGGGGMGTRMVGGVAVPATVYGLYVGTSVVQDEAVITAAVKIDAKYAAEIRAGRATRAGMPADSLVAKARVASAKRAEELRALLKSDDDRTKFDENLVAMTTGRGGI